MANQVLQYTYLMRLHKPVGILLLLWPTLWALWLASAGHPNYKVLFVFISGVILMRSAGCIINDYADRKFDGKVARTKDRPLATGSVKTKAALSLFVILSLCAFSLVLLLNLFTIVLSFVGILLAFIYPFLKRITNLPQLGLGLAFSWGVPMAFAAELNTIPAAGWLVFFTAALWPIIYDTMYAITDREDDLQIGIKSTAILFGKHDLLIVALLQIVFLICLVKLGLVFELHWPYFLSMILTALLFVYQFGLLQTHDPKFAFKAFLNNQWVGLAVFLGIAGSYMV